MKYIDYGSKKRENPDYTKGVMDGIGLVGFYIGREGLPREKYEEAKNILNKKYEDNPHYHYSSIIGPYCVACHCNLPGPNGEWE